MPEIDPITGLPKELGAFEDIQKEDQDITVKVIRRKFGKKYTIIEGLNENEIDIKSVAKTLKSKFACGGTYKDGTIELQGDHKRDIAKELEELGFERSQIQYD